VYGDGRNVRDWLFVDDHCRAIDHILAAGRPGRTYNVGGHSERENIDIVNLICDMTDALFSETPFLRNRFPDCPAACGASSQSLINFVADRPGHDRRYSIDCTGIERALGFSARTTLDDGLRRTLQWYVDNEPWWRQVMDGSYRSWVRRQYGTGQPT
jgi:dTDP-glucose 4,6-dehydratase